MFDVGCTIFDLARRHGGELSRFRQSYPAYDRPMLIFIALGLITYAAFLKLSPRLFRYSVSWRSVAIRMGHGVVLLLGLIILGG